MVGGKRECPVEGIKHFRETVSGVDMAPCICCVALLLYSRKESKSFSHGTLATSTITWK